MEVFVQTMQMVRYMNVYYLLIMKQSVFNMFTDSTCIGSNVFKSYQNTCSLKLSVQKHVKICLCSAVNNEEQ